MSGFVTYDRAIWDHPIFTPSPMSEREAFMWMIARAAYANTEHRVGVEIIQVRRGSFMVTLRELQSAFMWGSDKKVRNFLKKLENQGMLVGETLGKRNARKTHVTICNYDEYQTPGRIKDAAKTHRGRTGDAVNKQGNKGTRKEEGKPSSKKRASRLSENWSLPRDWGEWALGEGWPEIVIREQAEIFKDYWQGASGQNARKLDWFATWRNWMRKNGKRIAAVKGDGNGRSGKSTERMEAFLAGAAGVEEMDSGQSVDPSQPLLARR